MVCVFAGAIMVIQSAGCIVPPLHKHGCLTTGTSMPSTIQDSAAVSLNDPSYSMGILHHCAILLLGISIVLDVILGDVPVMTILRLLLLVP